MSSSYTDNYDLCQWEAADQVQRTDFNADNAKIDAALAELATGKADQSALNALSSTVSTLSGKVTRLTFGSYTGNGAASRTISLGFTPKAVLVFTNFGSSFDGLEYSNSHYGGLASTSRPVYSRWDSKLVMQIVAGGFWVAFEQAGTGDKILSNENGIVYYYIAFS